jgi:FtsP/CotA-like multicopper oxidase with cupredoxin domain
MRRRNLLKAGFATGLATAAGTTLGYGKKVSRKEKEGDGGRRLTPFTDPLPIAPRAREVNPFLPDYQKYPADKYPDHAGFPSLACKRALIDENQPYDADGMIRVRPNARFFNLLEEEADVQLHGELGLTRLWRFRNHPSPASGYVDGDYNENEEFSAVGPTFRVFMDEPPEYGPTYDPLADPVGGPVIVRIENGLPQSHIGFGRPITTTHFHGGHQESRSDGFPEATELVGGFDPTIEVGYSYDYCFAMRDTGFSHGDPDDPSKDQSRAGERPSLMWYHDHLLDFTGPNVYRGLVGFFLLFDDLDADDETGERYPQSLRLPSGAYDIPLVLKDARIDDEGQLVYLPEDHDGFLGDQFLINGKVQPFFDVEQRKYRFRILAGTNARWYLLVLEGPKGRHESLYQIGVDSSLLARTLTTDRLLVSSGERKDIIIDFSQYDEGDELYLTNVIAMDDGRGPNGDLKDGLDELLEDALDEGVRVPLLKFVVGPRVVDPSEVPAELRPLEEIPADLLAEARRNRRHFEFERTGGAWAINHEFADIDRALVEPVSNRPEIWTLENGAGGWWHPIHVHLDHMRVLDRDETGPFADEDGRLAKRDTIALGPRSVVEVFVHFRDFTGPFVFHCHNIEHEDMFMMAVMDIQPAKENAAVAGNTTRDVPPAQERGTNKQQDKRRSRRGSRD